MPDIKSLVDLRVYTIRPRRMADFIDVWDRLGMPVQMRYFDPPIGMFTGAVGTLNQLVHLWGFDDMGDFERRHAARDKDADMRHERDSERGRAGIAGPRHSLPAPDLASWRAAGRFRRCSSPSSRTTPGSSQGK